MDMRLAQPAAASASGEIRLGLRGQCVLLRTAHFWLRPLQLVRTLFPLRGVHASTTQLSIRYTGTTERLPMSVLLAGGRLRRRAVRSGMDRGLWADSVDWQLSEIDVACLRQSGDVDVVRQHGRRER